MAIVAGVDFGTLSVRVSLVDSERGLIGSALPEYPLHRKREDPDFATQSHNDHMRALAVATRDALKNAGIRGDQVEAIALDTTGSSVVPVASDMTPLDDYYLWCDHRAKQEAAEITELARQEKLEAIEWCGGVYSSEWGFAKLLHWLRHNPEKRDRFASAFEHCDMVAATLCGITNPADVKRSVCAMGHKWMWNAALGGLPPENFLTKVDPLLAGVRTKLEGRVRDLRPDCRNAIACGGRRTRPARRHSHPGRCLRRALGRHWSRAQEGDVVNVVGTSTCIIAYAKQAQLIPGVCGVVQGSVHPQFTGVEAGLSATGDIFSAIARRANTPVAELSKGLETYRAGQTGLLRMTWDNGDRTVLVNPNLGGITFGWNLQHTAQDELFAAIEGTAFHTRVILDRMSEYGAPTLRVINGGGIPQNNSSSIRFMPMCWDGLCSYPVTK